jgi:hypothetical protein
MSSPVNVHGLVPIPRALIVTYDLKTIPWNYSGFYAALKSQGSWWHYLSSSWIIITTQTPSEVYAALAPHLSVKDLILVMPVTRPAFGYLPKDAWDWINTNVR